MLEPLQQPQQPQQPVLHSQLQLQVPAAAQL
jgi:hypothetical protein